MLKTKNLKSVTLQRRGQFSKDSHKRKHPEEMWQISVTSSGEFSLWNKTLLKKLVLGKKKKKKKDQEESLVPIILISLREGTVL